MSLRRIYDGGVFDDATTDERRTRVYVRSGELTTRGGPRPDVELMNALVDAPGPQRIHVVGPSGAGKTSLILRVVADLSTRENLDAEHEVLMLRVGDQPAQLESAEAVMKMVLDTIAVNGHRFSNIDPDVFTAAAADQRTVNPTQVEHRSGLIAPVVSYAATIKEAFETAGFGQSAARVRHDLEDVLRQVAAEGYRPVLVLDDTEKFVQPGADGQIDVTSIENLYHHGVRVLGELDVDLVVAMHPRFEEVGWVTDVVARLGMPRVEVPELPADATEPGIAQILSRRMERDDLQIGLQRVIDALAVGQLQVLYHERDRDLRSVLKVAHAAAGRALDRGADAITARDIQEVVSGAD